MKLLFQLIFGVVVFVYVLSPALHFVDRQWKNILMPLLAQAPHAAGVK